MSDRVPREMQDDYLLAHTSEDIVTSYEELIALRVFKFDFQELEKKRIEIRKTNQNPFLDEDYSNAHHSLMDRCYSAPLDRVLDRIYEQLLKF